MFNMYMVKKSIKLCIFIRCLEPIVQVLLNSGPDGIVCQVSEILLQLYTIILYTESAPRVLNLTFKIEFAISIDALVQNSILCSY